MTSPRDLRADPSAEDVLPLLHTAVQPGPFLDRRLGRALAFQALYEGDLAHHGPSQVIERITKWTQDQPGPYPPDVLTSARKYALDVVEGVRTNLDEIDRVIQARASSWPIAQMSAVDRNVLRIGLYESRFGGSRIPLRAAINEAVDLAKMFGSETSGKFVNGVLGRAAEDTPRDDPTRQAP